MKIIYLILICTSLALSSEKIIKRNGSQYIGKTLLVKLKNNVRSSDESKLLIDGSKILKVKSAEQIVTGNMDFSNNDLSRWILVRYDSDLDPYTAAAKLTASGIVEYAEPKYVHEIQYSPNDPDYSSQYALQKISASAAWEISKGDTGIVVAIIDTGVDWDHPDLLNNMWRNWKEIPNNGIDDDNNGYVDDFLGWDFAGSDNTAPDNDPMEDAPVHGTHVAGIAGAVTDNGIGVASIGFNTRLMAVKTSAGSSRSLLYGYEGIKYAADNGAKIINCSWGSSAYSRFGQEIIDYALSKGALVIAAAGNNNSQENFYPASYTGVLSVANTNNTDQRSPDSNYGYNVDVAAPGVSIRGTWLNNSYISISGTSMSSPLAAGLAALVLSKFPEYSPLQVAEQIRVNTDDIYEINPSYINKLGSGRINAFKVLNNSSSVSVRALNHTFADDQPGSDFDGILEKSETVSLRVDFYNFLNEASSLSITLESLSSFVTVTNGNFVPGSLAGSTAFNNDNSKFILKISDDVPENYQAEFIIRYRNGEYNDVQVISAFINPTFLTQSSEDIAITITSKGTLGFNDYPNNRQGNGFVYLPTGENFLFEGALMIGTSSTKISDAARKTETQNNDFSVQRPFLISIPGSSADIQGYGVFNDDNAGASKLSLSVEQNSYSFSSDENSIILKYKINNNSGSEITNLYAGLFFDWDFEDAGSDITKYDFIDNFAFVYRQGGSPDFFIGAALISSKNYGFYAIKNDGGDGGISLFDQSGFTDTDKWFALSSGLSKTEAGPGDVSHVISSGPFTIETDGYAEAAFVLSLGNNQEELKNAVLKARERYKTLTGVEENNSLLPDKFYVTQNFPNPFNPETKILFGLNERSEVIIKFYDVLGGELSTINKGILNAGHYGVTFDGTSFSSGIYFYKVFSSSSKTLQTFTGKMILIK